MDSSFSNGLINFFCHEFHEFHELFFYHSKATFNKIREIREIRGKKAFAKQKQISIFHCIFNILNNINRFIFHFNCFQNFSQSRFYFFGCCIV